LPFCKCAMARKLSFQGVPIGCHPFLAAGRNIARCPQALCDRQQVTGSRRARLDPRAAARPWPAVVEDASSKHLPGVRFASMPPLDAKMLLQIVRGESSDATVNEVLRPMLGWVYNTASGTWEDDLVPPEWKDDYPSGPPDFIGSASDYSPEKDRPVKKAVQKLTRSIPSEYKQISREVLSPMGFAGWKINELTPNRTRRATAVNWILYYVRVHFPRHVWSLDE
jgi:hypothetical protein